MMLETSIRPLNEECGSSAKARNGEQFHGQDNLNAAELLPLVYDELRGLAARYMAHEKPGQTLDATGLVHEAYLRLVGPADEGRWDNHRHFFAAAAEAMRRILIERARWKERIIHGGEMNRVVLTDNVVADERRREEILAIHEALDRLAATDATAAELVKRRYFGGLSIEEAALTLGISRAEAYREWRWARAQLRTVLAGGSGDSAP
jgi:RNA polymerase sigma factor (TIGR02999 family)